LPALLSEEQVFEQVQHLVIFDDLAHIECARDPRLAVLVEQHVPLRSLRHGAAQTSLEATGDYLVA